MQKSFIFKYCFILLFVLIQLTGITQETNDSATNRQPTTSEKTAFIKALQKIGADETVRSIEKYKAGQIAIKQKFLIEEIKATTEQANIFMKKGLDTISILNELENTNNSLKIVSDGIFINKGTSQTQRNLAVSAAILVELIYKMEYQQNEVRRYSNNLIRYRDKIDSLSADSALYIFPSDSLAVIKYFERLKLVSKEISPTDSALNKSLFHLQDLQNQVDLMIYSLRSSSQDIERYRQELTAHSFDRDFANLTGEHGFRRPINEIVKFSFAKEKLAFNFYTDENTGKLLVLFLLILVGHFSLLSIKKRYQVESGITNESSEKLVLRYPLLSSIMIITSLFQFFFIEPPFIFNFCFWIIPAVCLTFIFQSYITKYWMRFWIVMMILFILASINNMVLQASRPERWFMLFLSAAGVIYGIYILLNGKHHDLKEKGILYFISFMVITEMASLLFNIFGRYNLSKTLLICGFAGLIIAILFLWTARLINQALSVTSSVYKNSDNKLFFIDFEKLGEKVPNMFYVLLVIGWIILVGRNFYEFKQIATPFIDFLNTERTLGDYTFSINSLFIFFLILISSLMLSKLISFIASAPENSMPSDHKNKKVGLGSWLLLIRILIISIGLFLAFAATGIPIDKLTIILGALSVGIGLGLQGLVNNLVSGLIIAFEKPVNVGDLIEINNKPGTVKSIGFRSSVVTLANGACLIIPNGDLLSQHLVNWTMGKNTKQLSILVGVAYDSDLEKVKELVSNILSEDSRILKHPPSLVVPKSFSAHSIDIELLFWVQISQAAKLTGDIITEINRVFKAEGIEIPFPQQDVHIRSIATLQEADKLKLPE